ncbi:MAG: hypothetical protein AAF827_11860 [Cyanobacteria bacterium P01_D01_bin.6]
MNTSKHQTAQAGSSELLSEVNELDAPLDDSLSLPRKAEIWSGRFAMLGFMTTAMAIVFKSTL